MSGFDNSLTIKRPLTVGKATTASTENPRSDELSTGKLFEEK